MDTSLHASTSVGVFGPLPASARTKRGRRRQTSGALSSPDILSGDGAVDSQATPGVQSVPGTYTRGTTVEARSDVELVQQTLDGNQDAFATLVERYKDAVQNLAYRMLSNATEAEDVTQEVFVRAYTQLATYKPQHKFSTWLLSIASHLAIDQLRRRRFLALPLEDVPFLEWVADLGAGPEQSALEGEQQDEIQSYLGRLPSKYRAVIVLRYWYDLPYDEIALALNLTPALVKARLHRARELLARYMKDNNLNEEEQVDALPRR